MRLRTPSIVSQLPRTKPTRRRPQILSVEIGFSCHRCARTTATRILQPLTHHIRTHTHPRAPAHTLLRRRRQSLIERVNDTRPIPTTMASTTDAAATADIFTLNVGFDDENVAPGASMLQCKRKKVHLTACCSRGCSFESAALACLRLCDCAEGEEPRKPQICGGQGRAGQGRQTTPTGRQMD